MSFTDLMVLRSYYLIDYWSGLVYEDEKIMASGDLCHMV